MKKRVLAATVAALLTSGASVSVAGNTSTFTLESEYHRLTDNQVNWHHDSAGAALRWESGLEVGAEVSRAERFGARDYGFAAHVSYPFTDHQQVDIRYDGAQNIDFQPKRALEAGYTLGFGNGFGVTARVGHETFHLADTNNDRYSLGGSYAYSDRYKAEYVFSHSRLNQGELSGNHHDLRWTFRPHSGYRLTLGAAMGDRVLQVGATDFLVSDTRSIYMDGDFALTQDWAVLYGVGKYNQKGAFDRTELSAGLRYNF